MNKRLIVIALMGMAFSVKAQHKLIQLDHNKAGNEDNPMMTVFAVDPMVQSTGTAVVLLPGSISNKTDNSKIAEWLSTKGVTSFLIDYGPLNEKNSGIMTMAKADGLSAIAYLRNHAADYKLLSNHIGLLGFSDAGHAAASIALDHNTNSFPDFVGIINPHFSKSALNDFQSTSPPLFIAAAANASEAKGLKDVDLYKDLSHTGQSTEFHLYAKENNFLFDTASGSWNNCFANWLKEEGFLTPLSQEETPAKKTAEGWANLKKYYDNLIYTDWPWLSKYKDANANLIASGQKENKVVFLGNSITENWYNIDSAFFKRNNYIGRGIGGQVSGQMLVRFREDVINLHPKIVVILAGTNDIAENRGPITIENSFGDIVSMVELARVNGIKPILCSVLPASDFPWHHGLNPAPKIIQLNKMLKEYANKNHISYVDYWSAMVNGKDGLKAKWAQDGFVHPNLIGYKVMEPLVKAAIDKALK